MRRRGSAACSVRPPARSLLPGVSHAEGRREGCRCKGRIAWFLLWRGTACTVRDGTDAAYPTRPGTGVWTRRTSTLSRQAAALSAQYGRAYGRSAPLVAAVATARRARTNRTGVLLTRCGWGDPVDFSPVKVVSSSPAADGLVSVVLEVGAEAVAGYTTPGQYVQMRTAEDGKAAFIAVANAPGEGGSTLEFLIKVRRCVEGVAPRCQDCSLTELRYGGFACVCAHGLRRAACGGHGGGHRHVAGGRDAGHERCDGQGLRPEQGGQGL